MPYRYLRVALAAALMIFLICTSLIRETRAPHKYVAILTFVTLLLMLLMWFLACRQWVLGLLALHFAFLTVALLHEMQHQYGDGVALYEFLSIFVVIVACLLLPSR